MGEDRENAARLRGQTARSRNTHHETSDRFRRGLVIVDNADSTLATRSGIEKPKGFILVLLKYGDTQNGTSSARRNVSETRVETIDGDIRLMSRDTRITERRLRCSVVPALDYNINQSPSTMTREEFTFEDDGIAKRGSHYLRIKGSPISGVASNCYDDGLSGCQINTGKNLRSA